MPCRSPQPASSRRFAVGKPSSRPRLSPWITVPDTNQGKPRSSVASRTRPAGKRLADRPGGNRTPVVLEPGHDIHREAALAALGCEKLRRSGAARAEMEIKADRRAADREPLDQDALDEFLGGEAGKRRVEGEHDRAVEPGRGEEPQFAGLVGQAEQRLVRVEEGARMRLESQRRRRPAERLGAVEGGARSRRGGRDARRRNCRWRRPRPARRHRARHRARRGKRLAAIGLQRLRKLRGRRCRRARAKSSRRDQHSSCASAAGPSSRD